MTVCKTCNGLGKIKLMPFGYICTCAECKGTGETRDYMTNEEWLRQASTEELAWFIADVCYELQDDIWSNCEDTSCDYRQTDKDYWVGWLKQPHHEKE